MQPVSYNIQDTYFGREYFKDCLNTCVPVCVWGGACSINGAAAHKLAKQESLPSEKGWCQGGKMWQMPMSKALDFFTSWKFLYGGGQTEWSLNDIRGIIGNDTSYFKRFENCQNEMRKIGLVM